MQPGLPTHRISDDMQDQHQQDSRQWSSMSPYVFSASRMVEHSLNCGVGCATSSQDRCTTRTDSTVKQYPLLAGFASFAPGLLRAIASIVSRLTWRQS